MNLDRIVGLVPSWVIAALSRVKSEVRRITTARKARPILAKSFANASTMLLAAPGDTAVYRVGEQTTGSILKIAFTDVSTHQLSIEAAALDEIAAMSELGDWRDQIAQVLDRGSHEHGSWFTQSLLPGVTIAAAHLEPAIAVRAAAEALRPIHNATQNTTSSEAVIDVLVNNPIATIVRSRPDLSEEFAAISRELHETLAHRTLTVARLHGDYSPTNVLWEHSTDSVSAIVDWKFGTNLQPPEIDMAHFAISLDCILTQSEYGSVVVDALAKQPNDISALSTALETSPNEFDVRTATLLTWLHHVSFGLEKAEDLRTNPIWLVNNIDNVARAVAKP